MIVTILAPIFSIVSFSYSSVGLGGGTAYVALMALAAIDPVTIPVMSLTLNLIVTSVGSFNYCRKGYARLELLLPFLISSTPMSYLGGSLHVPKVVVLSLLFACLVLTALRIYVWDELSLKISLGRTAQVAVSLIVGGLLGLVAGITGIGGGIYLVPLIIMLGLGTEKEAAAAGSVFIAVNSLSGLIARLQQGVVVGYDLLPLALAVLIGSAIGSYFGSSRFSPRTMQKMLGLIILAAIVALAEKIWLC